MKNNYMNGIGATVTAQRIIDSIEKLHRLRIQKQIPANSALLVIDMQQYFSSESSNACIPALNQIVPNINSLIEKFDSQKIPIIFTKHFNQNNSDNSMLRFWNGHLDKSSIFFELISKLIIPDDAIIIEKETYNAFHGTQLEVILQKLNIQNIFICGVFSHLCVETTARAAFVRNFDVSLVADATASYLYEYHFSTVLNLSHGVASISLTNDLGYAK